MRALVIDDERLARKELINLLNQLETVEVVGEAVNVEDAKEKIDQLHPDVIFLDIQMPEKTGFDLLEELDNLPHVIFTTAYDECAGLLTQAHRTEAIGRCGAEASGKNGGHCQARRTGRVW